MTDIHAEFFLKKRVVKKKGGGWLAKKFVREIFGFL